MYNEANNPSSSQMRKITPEYFYRDGQQNYAKKLSDHRHSVGTQHLFDPFQRFQHQVDYDTIDNYADQDIDIMIVGL